MNEQAQIFQPRPAAAPLATLPVFRPNELDEAASYGWVAPCGGQHDGWYAGIDTARIALEAAGIEPVVALLSLETLLEGCSVNAMEPEELDVHSAIGAADRVAGPAVWSGPVQELVDFHDLFDRLSAEGDLDTTDSLLELLAFIRRNGCLNQSVLVEVEVMGDGVECRFARAIEARSDEQFGTNEPETLFLLGASIAAGTKWAGRVLLTARPMPGSEDPYTAVWLLGAANA